MLPTDCIAALDLHCNTSLAPVSALPVDERSGRWLVEVQAHGLHVEDVPGFLQRMCPDRTPLLPDKLLETDTATAWRSRSASLLGIDNFCCAGGGGLLLRRSTANPLEGQRGIFT